MSDDSDAIPLTEDELTPSERKAIRRLIRDDERAGWAWRRFRVLVPAMVAVVTALWQFFDWVAAHWKA